MKQETKKVDWLTQNKDVLSFNSIESKYGIPQGTLSKVVKGTRPLPKKWVPILTELQCKMCECQADDKTGNVYTQSLNK